MKNFKKLMIFGLLSVSLLRSDDGNKNESSTQKTVVPTQTTVVPEQKTVVPEQKTEVKKNIKVSKKNNNDLKLEIQSLENKNEIYNIINDERIKSDIKKLEDSKQGKNEEEIALIDKKISELKNNLFLNFNKEKSSLLKEELNVKVEELKLNEFLKKNDDSLKNKKEELRKLKEEESKEKDLSKQQEIKDNIQKLEKNIKKLELEKNEKQDSFKNLLKALDEKRDKFKKDFGITKRIKINFKEVLDYAKNNKFAFGTKLFIAGFSLYGIYKLVSSFFVKSEDEDLNDDISNYQV